MVTPESAASEVDPDAINPESIDPKSIFPYSIAINHQLGHRFSKLIE